MRIKICGITREQDYLAAASLGADYLGFVFYPHSGRHISPERAAEIGLGWTGEGPQRVGVFVDAPAALINWTVDVAGLHLVQLHGDEAPDFNLSIVCPCWKALRIGSESDLGKLDRYRHWPGLLVEPLTEGVYGGVGKVFSRSLLGHLLDCFPRLILAGGVARENLKQWFALGVSTVDLCSALEEAPGVKSLEKMTLFFKEYRRLVAVSLSDLKGEEIGDMMKEKGF